MRFSFPHSHAFEGGRVIVDDDDAAEGPCSVEFADGVTVIGAVRKDGDMLMLEVPTYRTARNTDVIGRRWRIERAGDGVWRSRRAL